MPKKNHFHFKKEDIEALPLPEGDKRVWYWDTKCPGLALRISGKGYRIFYLYRWVGGKPQQKSLGTFPSMTLEQARRRAAELNGAVAVGQEDLQKASSSTRGEKTFKELFDWYFENYSKHKKSKNDDEMQNRLHFHGLASKRLSKITKADLRQLHREIAEKTRRVDDEGETVRRTGHYAANKALRLLRTVFNAAIKEDLYKGPNPAMHIDWFKEESRERRLMPSEIPTFLQAVDDEPNETVKDFVLMSLLTGARKSNVLEMRWEHIDFDSRHWYIPMTKNGKPQDVPLEDQELEILKRRKEKAEGPWVFPGDGGTGHMQDPRKGWLRILKRANLQGLRLHDLRRSLGSLMVDTGASLPMIGKALNHLSPSSTAIYARLSSQPVRDAKRKALAVLKDASVARDVAPARRSTLHAVQWALRKRQRPLKYP